MGCIVDCPCGLVADNLRRHGLLDLLPKIARPLLCWRHGTLFHLCCHLGLSSVAFQILPENHLHCCEHCRALPFYRFLCTASSVADGYPLLEVTKEELCDLHCWVCSCNPISYSRSTCLLQTGILSDKYRQHLLDGLTFVQNHRRTCCLLYTILFNCRLLHCVSCLLRKTMQRQCKESFDMGRMPCCFAGHSRYRRSAVLVQGLQFPQGATHAALHGESWLAGHSGWSRKPGRRTYTCHCDDEESGPFQVGQTRRFDVSLSYGGQGQ